MSVAQIKEEILQLTATERRAVEEFLRALAKAEPKVEEVPPHESSRRERFAEAKAHLFSHYGDLLEKLAR